MVDDKKLADRLRKGDENAFEMLIDKYTAYVSTIVFNIADGALTKSDIEEIVTDVFVTLWRNSGTLRGDNLKGYIACIAKCRTKDRLRKLKSVDIISIDEFEQPGGIMLEDDCEKQELCKSLREEVNKLNEPDREILIRYYYFYQKVSKISEIMGIKKETIKTKLARSRKRLKAALTERGF